MKRIIKFLASPTIYFAIFLMLIMPVFSFAQGLVACDGSVQNPCGFDQLMNLINKVISFIFLDLAIPIAAIMFFYAGFLLITAGGAEAKTKAKHIFTNAVIGLVIAAGAYLIIRTLLSVLGYDGAWIGF